MVLALVCAIALCATDAAANLLRNPEFQDDWATALPQSQTLHWSYPYDYQNRRDYNPDGWHLTGSWDWRGADAPAGERRLVMHAPDAEITQRVNWVAVHDDRQTEGFPDAGGFPSFAEVRSARPLAVVRDVTLRVLVDARDVPAEAAKIAVAYCPAGQPVPGDAYGTPAEPIAVAEATLPAGTYESRWVDVTLAAEAWRAAAEARGMGDDRGGWPLPGFVRVSIRYRAAGGEIQIRRAELLDRGTAAPGLLTNGGFEQSTSGDLPSGWSGPEKYRYFPPGRYYLFNTWHNSDFPNRGRPALDRLIVRSGGASLRMPALAGDEMFVRSDPIALRQREPRLIEVTAWVKTDHVNQLQIDAEDENGRRIDGFDFVNKAPLSVGTDDWRLVRQVFRPRAALESVRVLLCVRGVNGYTLGGGGDVPQNNVAGTVWWDDVRVAEPESSAAELAERNVMIVPDHDAAAGVRLTGVDLGEQLIGDNVFAATVRNPGAAAKYGVELRVVSPDASVKRYVAPATSVATGGERPIGILYRLDGSFAPYTERRLEIRVIDDAGGVVGGSEAALASWTAPLAIELGALYLDPSDRQFVRLNIGLSAAEMARASLVRLEIVRRGDGTVADRRDVPATTSAIAAARERIPAALRGDFRNLVLADLDVARLPIEPFTAPERRWIVRATLVDRAGRPIATVDSPPFARLAHTQAQPPIRAVSIRENTVHVNDAPWLPWGANYGFTPHYAGPAVVAPDAVRNLRDLPGWSYYEGFGSAAYERRRSDFNCARDYPAGEAVTDPTVVRRIDDRWKTEGLYTGTFFVVPSPGVFSLAALNDKAGGAAKLAESLDFARDAPMVVSTGPGFEESFGVFHAATAEDLAGLEKVVEELRTRTRKPVMVGHGGAWNRFEFEKVPFFDVFDPETEPLHPANLQTDLFPLVAGKQKAIWLRPQVYESVPFERWRFHTLVELMRGARGWQFAHGPSDASMMRGLHAEIDSLKEAAVSVEPTPAVDIDPPIEHWARRRGQTTYVIAATTHAMPFGSWRWSEAGTEPGNAPVRVSERSPKPPSDDVIERLVESADGRWVAHGIDAFPVPRTWSAQTRLVQSVRIDPAAPPKAIAFSVKTQGRWRSLAGWGAIDAESLKRDLLFGYWFLRSFYPNAVGFIGYEGRGLASALAHLPDRMSRIGELPASDRWTELSVPLADLAAGSEPIEGIGFLQDGGRVYWGDTALVSEAGGRDVVWSGSTRREETRLAAARIGIAGLAAGARVRVLFEDREIRASAGAFTDDFRGADLYQRYGGLRGYGPTPVAVHVYAVPTGSVQR